MIDNLELLRDILRLSLTIAALSLPSISIAYFIMSQNESEIERMSKIIGFSTIGAILMLICSLVTFFIIFFGGESFDIGRYISCSLFILGCFAILYVLFILAGFKRELPSIQHSTPEPHSTLEEKSTVQPEESEGDIRPIPQKKQTKKATVKNGRNTRSPK